MKLAFSTNAFVKYSIGAAISKIISIGYRGVEILADKPHIFFPLSERVQSKIAYTLRESGAAVSNINVNTARGFSGTAFHGDPFEPSLTTSDETKRRWRIDYTRQAIGFASLVNARNISITSGRSSRREKRASMARFLDSLQRLVEYAEAQKIGIGIEYEPGLLVGNAAETLEIIRRIDSSYLGVNLDIGHCGVAGEDISETIKTFRNRIFNLHVEDIRRRRHYHLIPGTGDIDFVSVLKALNKINYDRYLTVELYTYAGRPVYAAQKALSYLRQVEQEAR